MSVHRVMTMLKHRLTKISIAAVAATMIASSAFADDALSACAKESDDARRLACYDRVSRGQSAPEPEQSNAPPAAVKPEPKPAEPPAATATDEFGVTGSAVARQRSSEQKQETKPKVQSVTAEVTEVSWRPHGEFVATLDNGQVWAQKDPGQRFLIKPGDRVTINAGMLGSYRLVNGPRSTQVTRIK